MHSSRATGDALGILATDEGRSNREVRDEARTAIIEWLDRRGQQDRFAEALAVQPTATTSN
jgi:hypothetical protein